MGIAYDENYLCVKWSEGDVLFSFARRGNALCCHFAASHHYLREIKSAINDFVVWAFDKFPWCTMLFAFVLKPSVERLISKLGFKYLKDVNETKLYVRQKWAE